MLDDIDELHSFSRIDQLKEEKKRYSKVTDIVQQAIPFLPSGCIAMLSQSLVTSSLLAGVLQADQDPMKGLYLRYETLLDNKQRLQRNDFPQQVPCVRLLVGLGLYDECI